LIVDNEARGTIKGLIDNHFTDPRWREVFLLMASLLDNADDFFKKFKQAIDKLMVDDETLVKLLNWSAKKVATINQSSLISVYCFLGIFLDRTLTQRQFLYPDLVRDFTLSLARDFTKGLARDLARVLVRYLNIVQNLVRYRGFDRDHVRELDFLVHLAFNRNKALALDLDQDFYSIKIDLNLTIILQVALVYLEVPAETYDWLQNKLIQKFTVHFIEFIKLIQKENLHDLHQALIKLKVPNENDTQKAWEPFVRELRKIMQTQHNIGHEWDFTTEQFKCLEKYFEANLLLLECLNLAAVSDREGIKNSLLLLPSDSSPS